MNYFSIIAVLAYIFFFINGNYVFLYIGILVGIIILYQHKKNLNSNVLFFIMYIIFSYFILLSNNVFEHGKTYIPIFLSSLGIAIGIINNYKIHKKFSTLLLFFLFGYFYIYLLINLSLKDSTQFSVNHVSTILLFVLTYYYFINHVIYEAKFNIIPVYLFLGLTIFAANMSGIFCSLIILGGYYYLYNVNKFKFYIYAIFFILLFNFLLINLFFVYTNGYIELLDKFSIYRLFENNERLNIWLSYYNLLDFKRLIFGLSINETLLIGNLHNSFLLLHAKVGIVMLYFLYLYFRILYKYYQLNNIMFYILLALLFRSSFDTIAFHGAFFEWVILLILFSSYNQKGLKNEKNIVYN